MERSEMEIIKQLMEELQGAMEYDEDDLSERLGRSKPGIEVVKMEGEIPMDGDEMDMMDGDDMMSDEDKLKKRLMALRGE